MLRGRKMMKREIAWYIVAEVFLNLNSDCRVFNVLAMSVIV